MVMAHQLARIWSQFEQLVSQACAAKWERTSGRPWRTHSAQALAQVPPQPPVLLVPPIPDTAAQAFPPTPPVAPPMLVVGQAVAVGVPAPPVAGSWASMISGVQQAPIQHTSRQTSGRIGVGRVMTLAFTRWPRVPATVPTFRPAAAHRDSLARAP